MHKHRFIKQNLKKIPPASVVVSPGTFTRSISTPFDSVVLSLITIFSVVSTSIVALLVISSSDVAEAFTIIDKGVLVTSIVKNSDVLLASEAEAFVIDAVVTE